MNKSCGVSSVTKPIDIPQDEWIYWNEVIAQAHDARNLTTIKTLWAKYKVNAAPEWAKAIIKRYGDWWANRGN